MEQLESLSTQERIRSFIIPWQKSGKTLKKFCREEQISYHAFRYWLKKWGIRIHTDKESPIENNFLPLVIEKDHEIQFQFSEKIEIKCPNGIEIRLPGTTDIRFIKALVGIV
jgi:hypothetical protein